MPAIGQPLGLRGGGRPGIGARMFSAIPVPRVAHDIISSPAESAWELHERIGSVAILSGRGDRLAVYESTSAVRLLRELRRLAREDIPVRGMICGLGALDRRSIRALNAVLRYGRPSGSHRFAWHDLQERIAARWVR